MSELDRTRLHDIFVSSYETMRICLTHRLGCEVLARETLQDTYLRLHNPGNIAVGRPHAYLLRMALNVAYDNRRRERRWTPAADLGDVAERIGDDAADSTRHVAARQELERLEAALLELTPRRRRILLEQRLRGRMLWQIAADMEISQRLVELELKAAVAHCAQRLGRSVVRRFGPRPGVLSGAPPGRPAIAE